MANQQPMNPRYVAYCKLQHGSDDPDAVLASDRIRWSGGCMAGFIIWIRQRWAEFARVRPSMNMEIKTTEDHAAFDHWLAAGAQEGAMPDAR